MDKEWDKVCRLIIKCMAYDSDVVIAQARIEKQLADRHPIYKERHDMKRLVQMP